MHFKLFRHLDRPPQRVGLTVFEGADTASKTESCLKAGRLPACPHPGAAPHWSVQSLSCVDLFYKTLLQRSSSAGQDNFQTEAEAAPTPRSSRRL